MADHILSFPAWAGSRFVPRGPKQHGEIPAILNPANKRLPTPFTAVITGASRGIGAAIAKAFAQAGATGLILTARKAADVEGTKKTCLDIASSKDLKISILSADNAAEASAVTIAEIIRKDYDGKLDLLINNAGIIGTDETMFAKVGDISSSQIKIPTNVNYLGRFYMTKHLLPAILSNPRPTKSIINISSIGSQVSGPLGFSISALATNRLSQRVAESYADQGVFCAALHPGAVWPEVVPPGFPPAMKEMSTDNVGLAGAWLVWLVGERKEWLNGRYLDATWDVDELQKRKDEIVEKDLLKMRLVV